MKPNSFCGPAKHAEETRALPLQKSGSPFQGDDGMTNRIALDDAR
jgi:hypothetical protein